MEALLLLLKMEGVSAFDSRLMRNENLEISFFLFFAVIFFGGGGVWLLVFGVLSCCRRLRRDSINGCIVGCMIFPCWRTMLKPFFFFSLPFLLLFLLDIQSHQHKDLIRLKPFLLTY